MTLFRLLMDQSSLVCRTRLKSYQISVQGDKEYTVSTILLPIAVFYLKLKLLNIDDCGCGCDYSRISSSKFHQCPETRKFQIFNI